MTVLTYGEWTVCTLDGPSLDAANCREVGAELIEVSRRSRRLAVDWSNVVYVDLLGMEAVLDVFAEHEGRAAFVGADRNVTHFVKRLQLLPVLPMHPTLESLQESP